MNNTLERIERGEFFLIAGPCAIESEQLCLDVAARVNDLARRHDLPYIFKSSYKKANRSAAGTYAGPGLEAGLIVLKKVKAELGIPVLTDIHETPEIGPVAEVADVLQIPAFLCRQTDLVVQAAATGRWINIKKGQFLAPDDMTRIAAKAGSGKIMLTERGSTFGYHNLVIDFRSLVIMKKTGCRVVFDATHSLQLPGGGDGVSLGQPEFVIPMARAAMAVGIDGLFVETHPEPAKALCDAGVMLPIDRMEQLLDSVLRIRDALK
ncbi:MAG: 3-deoxy-8-phosphooctulonate synthase [Candidatus Zixiibacteriota bacterium]